MDMELPTNDERRKVAANIRNAANSAKDDLQDNPNYSAFAVVYVVSCGVRRSFPRYEDLMYLADLIEPAPERTCHLVIEDETAVCSECGEDIDGYGWLYCPNCGAKIIEEPADADGR